MAFALQRFGAAPVTVYWDASGRSLVAFNAMSHPSYRFVTRRGRLTNIVPVGFPFS